MAGLLALLVELKYVAIPRCPRAEQKNTGIQSCGDDVSEAAPYMRPLVRCAHRYHEADSVGHVLTVTATDSEGATGREAPH